MRYKAYIQMAINFTLFTLLVFFSILCKDLPGVNNREHTVFWKQEGRVGFVNDSIGKNSRGRLQVSDTDRRLRHL